MRWMRLYLMWSSIAKFFQESFSKKVFPRDFRRWRSLLWEHRIGDTIFRTRVWNLGSRGFWAERDRGEARIKTIDFFISSHVKVYPHQDTLGCGRAGYSGSNRCYGEAPSRLRTLEDKRQGSQALLSSIALKHCFQVFSDNDAVPVRRRKTGGQKVDRVSCAMQKIIGIDVSDFSPTRGRNGAS